MFISKSLIADKELEMSINVFALYGSAMVGRSTIGYQGKRVMASETGKAELHDIFRSGHPFTDVSPELLQHMPL
jgi:hypothetical protein